MTDDIYVDGLSRRDIEERALAWRAAFKLGACWQPDMLAILEVDLPRKWPDFSVVVKADADADMTHLEAYTQFQPPQIVFRNAVYRALCEVRHRARWTAAHELGHLVLHEAVNKARPVETKSRSIRRAYNSAEWQANTFASCFLMPEHVISEFSSAEEISRNCGVSLMAAEIRFRQVIKDAVPAYQN